MSEALPLIFQHRVCAREVRLAFPPLGEQRGEYGCAECHNQNDRLSLQHSGTDREARVR